jgi:hypothetical protein
VNTRSHTKLSPGLIIAAISVPMIVVVTLLMANPAAAIPAPWGHGRGARRCWRVGHVKSGLFSLYS